MPMKSKRKNTPQIRLSPEAQALCYADQVKRTAAKEFGLDVEYKSVPTFVVRVAC